MLTNDEQVHRRQADISRIIGLLFSGFLIGGLSFLPSFSMEPRQFLAVNLSLVDKVIDGVCRRARLRGADAEDFASSARLALIEDDYSVLRKYEGRASLATYLAVVFERLLSDARVRQFGRWYPSAEATRMGAAGVLLETLIRRDRRTLDEALPLVLSLDPLATRGDLESMLTRLPERLPRPHAVDFQALPETLASRETADAALLDADVCRISDRVSRTVRHTLAGFAADDRALVRMRFVAGLSIADIARMTRRPQRPLYRRFEELLDRLRKALRLAGLTVHDVSSVVSSSAEIDFGLENDADHQSATNEEMR